jgi:hypothetical protein
MEKLKFWWHYLTNRSFHHYVDLRDYQFFLEEIKRMREENLRY